MIIKVLTENRKIKYVVPSGTDAEEFVANYHSLNEVSYKVDDQPFVGSNFISEYIWGDYEEEVVYADCQLCIDGVHVNEITDEFVKANIKYNDCQFHNRWKYTVNLDMEQASKQMEQDGL